MNFELLKRARIEVDDALVRFSGNKELLEKYLVKFADEPVYVSFVESMEEKNWANAEKDVHSLKGITGSLGMTLLFQQSSDVLRYLREQNYDMATDLYQSLKEEYNRVVDIIKKANKR